MKKPTYAEQWQKLTEAYVNDRVDPYTNCACFVGNLLNTDMWCYARIFAGRGDEKAKAEELDIIKNDGSAWYEDGVTAIFRASNGLYDVEDIISLEQLFLSTYNSDKSEDGLFKAFVVTLELLKQIHISKGEVIDETPVFTKRILVAQ